VIVSRVAELARLEEVLAALTRPAGPAGGLPAVPVRRRHDRRGTGVPERVEYNDLPWKYAAGTPDILGAIVSAQALRPLLNLALTPKRLAHFGTGRPLDRAAVRAAMDRVAAWNQQLTSQALDGLAAVRGITILRPPRRGPAHLARRLQPRGP
jgi:selenocysteine lyase/cysteine desulfurase